MVHEKVSHVYARLHIQERDMRVSMSLYDIICITMGKLTFEFCSRLS